MIVGAITAVTVDEVHGFVYWSDYSDAKVRRARLDGTNLMEVYSSKLSCVTDKTRNSVVNSKKKAK